MFLFKIQFFYRQKKKEVKEEDSVFHAKPVRHKRSSEKPREVNLDNGNSHVLTSVGKKKNKCYFMNIT